MGAAFAYDISFLRYYQYEKEQNDDFPLYFAHRSLPAVHVCLSDRSDSYYELFQGGQPYRAYQCMELLRVAKLFQDHAQRGLHQLHEKHADDLAGWRHHYYVPSYADGCYPDQRHPRRKILQGRHLYAQYHQRRSTGHHVDSVCVQL